MERTEGQGLTAECFRCQAAGATHVPVFVVLSDAKRVTVEPTTTPMVYCDGCRDEADLEGSGRLFPERETAEYFCRAIAEKFNLTGKISLSIGRWVNQDELSGPAGLN